MDFPLILVLKVRRFSDKILKFLIYIQNLSHFFLFFSPPLSKFCRIMNANLDWFKWKITGNDCVYVHIISSFVLMKTTTIALMQNDPY